MNIKLLNKAAIILIANILLLGFSTGSEAYTVTNTSAEARSDFVLEPGKVEIFVNPGETVTRNIAIINRIEGETDFRIEVEDFIGSQNVDTPVVLLDNDTSPYAFRKNIAPEIDRFSLTLGQRIQIPVTITVPEDARPGGYYSSVIVSNVPKESDSFENVGQTKIISRLGLLIFIRVNGPVEEIGRLEDFRVRGANYGIVNEDPAVLEILYRNEGNVHLVPYGIITIKNMFGKEVGKVPVDAYFAMPDSLRYREVQWSKNGSFGRYTATLNLSRGYGDLSDTKKIVFWILPWKVISIVVISIFILISIIFFVSRKFEFKRKQ